MEVAHLDRHHNGTQNGFGRSSGGKQPRPDRRPAALINDPAAFKKCGHCQEMKPCVEFSADVSRGDGLRGWCKVCEAEARSNRYKKRKAVALENSAARRRLEQPLGGLQQFHVSHMDGREPSSPPPQLQHHEHPIAAAAAQQQQRRHLQALEAQLVANLQEQPLPPQHPRHHQQQQQPLDVRYLQHQMALWQAQRDAAAQAEARAAQAALAANRQSAFHATTHGGAAPSAGLPLAFGLGGSSVQEAAAAYLAAAAAGAHTLQLGMPGHPPPHAQAAAARAKVAHRSPDTSDSDTDAAAALTGMKRGRLLRSPARPAAGAEQLWRTSAGSEDSAATASMVSLPQPAPSLQPLSATAPASDLWPAAVSRPAAAAKALAVRHNAPLPPADQPHIPRRARTRTTLPADADGVAAAGAMALAGPLVEFQPPRGDLEEIKQWSSRILAMMLMLRAAGFRA